MLSPRLHLKCRGRGSGGTKSNLVPYSLISRLSRRLIVDAWQATQRCRPIDADRLMQTYRLNAEKCLVLARSFNDRERRLALLDMANAWLTLTERHLRNREAVLVYAIPTPLNEPPPPADQPPKPPPIDEPGRRPPMKDSPPPNQAPPQRLDPAGRNAAQAMLISRASD